MYVWLLVDVAIGQLWSDCWAGGGGGAVAGAGRSSSPLAGGPRLGRPPHTRTRAGMEAGARARDTHAITIHIPSHGDPHTMQTWKRSLEFHKY